MTIYVQKSLFFRFVGDITCTVCSVGCVLTYIIYSYFILGLLCLRLRRLQDRQLLLLLLLHFLLLPLFSVIVKEAPEAQVGLFSFALKNQYRNALFVFVFCIMPC